MKFRSDIDIDFADRSHVLKLIKHTPAAMIKDGSIAAHNTGIYVTDIPFDPITGLASIDYRSAEDRGYVKLDFLNVHVYNQIENKDHLVKLLKQEPEWHKLYDSEFCSKLIHIGNHYDTLIAMPEAVTSIEILAMFLAIIRPAKRHLIGLPWSKVKESVWTKPTDGSYYFKKSHSISYSHLVTVHMNLLTNSSNQGN